jgi:hypothetical protein
MLGVVEDVEGLEAVSWLRGIGQWGSGLGELLGGGCRSPSVIAWLKEGDGKEEMARERK